MEVVIGLAISFIIALIIILFYSRKTIEGYDAMYTNISIDDCAGFCKTTANCHGFGYDLEKKICYPSNKVIFGKPFYSIYSDSYKNSNFICNKVMPIIDPDMTPAFYSRKTNAMFTCGQHEALSERPTMYMHNQGELGRIFEGQNPDFITQVDEYSVYEFIWPNNKYEGEQLNNLGRKQDTQVFKLPMDQIVNMDRMQKVMIVPHER